jgi:uracil-DNA glycosylase family 4
MSTVKNKQQQLDELKSIVAQQNLLLKDTATNLVFGKGNAEASVVFVGEAPGKNEDLQGIPFVGSAGKNLEKLFNLIDLTLDDIYIANILKYRPPDNRPPSKEEIIQHTPFLIEQIKIIQPKVIVTLGNFATKFILCGFDPHKMKTVCGITDLHGQRHTVLFGEHTFSVIPLYHPAACLYNPKLRTVLEEDFRIIKKHLIAV